MDQRNPTMGSRSQFSTQIGDINGCYPRNGLDQATERPEMAGRVKDVEIRIIGRSRRGKNHPSAAVASR